MLLDRRAPNNGLVVLVMTGFYRIGGDYDYLLKVVTQDMNSYDAVYRRLIEGVELDAVTSNFAMEAIEEQRPLLVGG